MEKPKWLVLPCERCPRRHEQCSCGFYVEWFAYAWDHMCAYLRNKWGLGITESEKDVTT